MCAAALQSPGHIKISNSFAVDIFNGINNEQD